MRGTAVQRIGLMHVSLVALLVSSAVAFWLEYLTLVPRLGALTWTLAAWSRA